MRSQIKFMVPVARLREHIILSALVGALAFALFVLTFLWDQNLWVAVVALPIAWAATVYALACGRALSRSRHMSQVEVEE